MQAQRFIPLFHLKNHAVGLHLGKFSLTPVALPPCELCLIFLFSLSLQGQDTSSPMLSPGSCHFLALAVAYDERSVQMLSLVRIGLEGDALFHACNPASSLGEKRNLSLRLFFLCSIVPAQGAQRHVMGVVPGFRRLLVDGKDAAIEFVVVPEILLLHLAVEEPVFCPIAMLMFIDSPVELPTGVSPEFVVSAVERVA